MSTSKVFYYLIHMKIINVQYYQLMKIKTKYVLRGNTESSNYLANVKTIKRFKDRGKKKNVESVDKWKEELGSQAMKDIKVSCHNHQFFQLAIYPDWENKEKLLIRRNSL